MPSQENTPPPLSEKEARLQRVLKVIVVVLGIAILVVLGIMVAAIVGGGRDRAPDSAPPSASDRPTVASFAERELRLPPGAAVIDMTVGEGLLAVRYRTAAGAEEIALLDAGTGEMRGRIKIIVEPRRHNAPVPD